MSYCRNFQIPVTSSVTRIAGRRPSFGPCLRCFSSSTRQASQSSKSSKRELQTATTYRPHTFSSPFPPKNAGTPDTSISASIPGLNTTQHSQHPQAPTSSSELSIPEREAQKSEPVVKDAESSSSTSSTQKSTSSKPKRSKLRPRKAAMHLTPAAISHLRELVSQPDPKMIRVGVKNRGCSGLAYHLEYVEKPGAFDEAVEQDGVKVLVDSKALFSIIGSEMDWEEDKLSSRFVFRNPNIKDECGCGESFMV